MIFGFDNNKFEKFPKGMDPKENLKDFKHNPDFKKENMGLEDDNARGAEDNYDMYEKGQL
jgi:hypothetical protein